MVSYISIPFMPDPSGMQNVIRCPVGFGFSLSTNQKKLRHFQHGLCSLLLARLSLGFTMAAYVYSSSPRRYYSLKPTLLTNAHRTATSSNSRFGAPTASHYRMPSPNISPPNMTSARICLQRIC